MGGDLRRIIRHHRGGGMGIGFGQRGRELPRWAITGRKRMNSRYIVKKTPNVPAKVMTSTQVG